MSKKSIHQFLVVVFLALAPSYLFAATINLFANLDGSQANAGVGTGSPGTGTATMTLDNISNLFNWNISWSGLVGTETVMHFHGPALPNQNAGVEVDFGAISGISSPSIGSTTITGGQATDLLAGLWYINIHSTVHQGGEIRGQVQVVPVPAAIWLLGSGVLGLMAMTAKRRLR